MKLGKFISGSVVHRYWERYTHHFEMLNKIGSRIRPKQQSIKKGGWILTMRNMKTGNYVKDQG